MTWRNTGDLQQSRTPGSSRLAGPRASFSAGSNGRPQDRRRDHAEWKALLSDAGGARLLRGAGHTAATLLIAEGVHVGVIMELLGSFADEDDRRHL